MRRFIDRVWEILPRPLDPLRSIKIKIGILVAASVGAAMGYFTYSIGWWPRTSSITAFVLALAVTQLLAHGMTAPLQEMTAAVKAMATGDYSRRVRATSRDELGDLGRAFNQMADDLAAADRQRRELIANVSHELRTPISALHAVLENLVDGVEEPDPAKLATTLAQTERLGRLVNELLDLSSIDAGAMPLDRERLSVEELFADVISEMEISTATTGRQVRFEATVDPGCATVQADRERLYQVLMNLLDNAARHSPPNSTVSVSAVRAGAVTTIDVVDSGPGIPLEDRLRVFERFTRGDRASNGGTGLGLSIARWIVDLHGGSIAVVDQQAPGCRIRVTLPDEPGVAPGGRDGSGVAPGRSDSSGGAPGRPIRP